jgi:hypothetical protein
MKRLLSRRMVLRGATGAALTLPLLNDIPRAHAQAKSADAGAPAGDAGSFDAGSAAGGDAGLSTPVRGGPKRCIIMFSPNGTIPAALKSTGSGATFTPGTILQPLVDAHHKNDLTVVHNLDMSVAMDGPGGDAHGLGIGCMLTGLELAAGNMFLAGMGGAGSGWPAGISVDQYIASRLPQRQFRSIDFAVKRMSGSIWSRMSYTGGGGLTVDPFDDPSVAYAQLFANVGVSSSTVALQTMRRKSVLDEVMGELQALIPSLSGADKLKVEAHLAQLRQIEMGLAASVSACVKPMAPAIGASAPVLYNASGMEIKQSPNADADVPLRNQLAQDMLVAAMACDMARVGTIMMAPSRSDIFLTWVPGGMANSHHDLSHLGNADMVAQQTLVAINQWYASQVARLVTGLKAVPENGGTMFDNTVVLWINELGIGNAHTHTNIPVVLVGSAGGYFKTGQAVTMPAGTPHNRLLLSLCRAMGLNDTVFGNPKFCTAGPIAEIAV